MVYFLRWIRPAVKVHRGHIGPRERRVDGAAGCTCVDAGGLQGAGTTLPGFATSPCPALSPTCLLPPDCRGFDISPVRRGVAAELDAGTRSRLSRAAGRFGWQTCFLAASSLERSTRPVLHRFTGLRGLGGGADGGSRRACPVNRHYRHVDERGIRFDPSHEKLSVLSAAIS